MNINLKLFVCALILLLAQCSRGNYDVDIEQRINDFLVGAGSPAKGVSQIIFKTSDKKSSIIKDRKIILTASRRFGDADEEAQKNELLFVNLNGKKKNKIGELKFVFMDGRSSPTLDVIYFPEASILEVRVPDSQGAGSSIFRIKKSEQWFYKVIGL